MTSKENELAGHTDWLPPNIPPSKVEEFIQKLIKNDHEIPGITSPPSIEMILDFIHYAERPFVNQIKTPLGEVVLLPHYVAREITKRLDDKIDRVLSEKAITLRAEFTCQGQSYPPRPILPFEKDQAVERGLILFELTELLEQQRSMTRPNRTVVLGLFPSNPIDAIGEFWSATRRIGDRLDNGFNFYDFLAVWWPKDKLPKGIIDPAYPIPPFFEQTFRLEYQRVLVVEMISFLLKNYADRVVIVPRLRRKHGESKIFLDDAFFAASYNIAQKFSLEEDEWGIFDTGRLLDISSDKLKGAGVSAYEAADLEVLESQLRF